jgi:hypothetical protein
MLKISVMMLGYDVEHEGGMENLKISRNLYQSEFAST